MANESFQMLNNASEYSTLSSYNVDPSSRMAGIAQYSSGPYNPGVPSMAVQVIPQFGASGYSALQHNAQGVGGNYFTVNYAYPGSGPGQDQCTRFAARQCN